MEAPPGFSEGFETGEGCRLKKTLYGLKQSPRVWFGRFKEAMTKYGFRQSNSDHTLFLKKRDERNRKAKRELISGIRDERLGKS